ncbi:polysaccharide deacetylase [Clostridium beijerinckii]|uniref:polysaccharide deacetylase family protein n=1 Tax=Clostridium beijerinckii TaxID=1520 RepID=UPI001493E3B7|nr:polysaccharide deacetylase family protein [Clostridium beijerinckii]NOW07292.1 peptidoglycan/xylan/chitin deacetylase (PgdA/CDA1 family) [Clostridium beijerinckii]NYC04935.1 peptidoglycan/xylan/chitin deacetylase (PgdA/CDA1 family) [Clostridium beijerinckii]UYZ35475.1 polysaccharide deacetylase [Clostridium beijerinckii]
MSDDINNSMNYSNETSKVAEVKEAGEAYEVVKNGENSEIDDNSKHNENNSEINDISDNIRPFEIDEVGEESFDGIKKRKFAILLTIIAAAIIIGIAIAVQKSVMNKQTAEALNANGNPYSEGDKNQTDSDVYNSARSSEVEDVAFIEKYLNQQMKGQMPDGADGKKVVYLTFDDGPSETVTPKVLDTLKAENVHATFFLVGKAIDESETNKNIVKRELAEGNAIGNHTYSHNYGYLYPNGKINLENCMSDFEKTNQSLKNILGQDFSTRAVRFPGGQMTWDKKDPSGADAMDKALHEKDYHQIDWNSLSQDAEGAHKNAEQLKQEVIKTVSGREKAIILMHDTYGKEETAKALPEIIKYLKQQGYEFKIMK